MIKTERHFIKGTSEIINLCSLSKDLYNRCLYLIRQAYFNHERLPDISILVNSTKDLKCFKKLHNTKTAKQTVRRTLTDFSNFKKAQRAFYKNPENFLSKPKPPKYKKKLSQVIFYNETISRKTLKQNIIQPTNKCFSVQSNTKDFKQVLITPKTFGFIIDIQYEVKEKKNSKRKGVCFIDLGVNNLAAITSDQHSPILINGRLVKSINQYYNKYPTKKNSKKRYFRLENYFHHVSKYIITLCKSNDIGRIIMGKNDYWKQVVKMRKKTKQSFQYVPFHKLIQKIQYKAKLEGINVEFTEESYTSKCSFVDKDPLDGSIISGKRIKRGLYKSKEGKILNADINGSLNIGRKVIGENIYDILSDRSVSATPVRINPLRKSVGEELMVNSSNFETCKIL